MKYSYKTIILSNGEEIEVESAKTHDAQSLWNFGYTVAQDHEFQAMFPDEFTIRPEDEPKFIKDCEDHACKLALVARSKQGVIVGMCTMIPVSRLRKMQHVVSTSIGIIPQYRDQKLGQILMKEALQAIKINSEIEKIELRVLSSNVRAISLYRKLGFLEVGRLKNEFKFSSTDYRDDILMELLIN